MKQHCLLIVLVLSVLGICHPALPQGTAFTYQGRLHDASGPAAGMYDLRFRVWDSELSGSPTSTTLTYTVPITNGLFTVILDFGSGVFTGPGRWLEVSVSTNGAGAFTALRPRQPMTATPYAITAAGVSGNVSASQVSGTIALAQLPAAVVTNNSSNLTLAGVFTGDGTGMSNVNAAALGGLTAGGFWKMAGNSVSNGQFLGSINDQPVEIWAGSARVLRLEPTAENLSHSNIFNMVGGASVNSIAPGVYGSVIAGGGARVYSAFGGNAVSNAIGADMSFVGGGLGNTIAVGGEASVLGGGSINSIGIGAHHSVVGGGWGNKIKTNAYESFLGGGIGNSIEMDASESFLGGGSGNLIQSNANRSVVVGGFHNSIQVGAWESVLMGGWGNAIQPNATGSVLGGGFVNTIQRDLGYSVLVGGWGNSIQTNADLCALVGGHNNHILPGADGAFLGGGDGNSILTGVWGAFLGGGFSNTVSGTGAVVVGGGYDGSVFRGNTASATAAVVVGGNRNLASGNYSTVGGGYSNSATNWYATVPGGGGNVAGGQGGFAAGRSAKSVHDGSFVWNDGATGEFVSTAANQFLIHAGAGVGINTNNPNGAALNVNGAIQATSFVGSGDNLTSLNAVQLTGTIADARLSANVARLNATQTFTGQNTFQNLVQMQTNIFMNDRDMLLRNDLFHGLGWYGAGKTFAGLNVDGPALYGNAGGVLGSRSSSATNAALSWNSAGNVALDPLAVNTGNLLPGLSFGGNSGEGISSKRTAGTGQFGLDFYANYARRMRIANNGNVGINTDTPQSTLQVNGTVTVDANLKLPVTTADAGIIYSGTNTFLHEYGDFNFFGGESAGNLTMTGWGNVGIGWKALGSNAVGNFNTGLGYATLNHNTAGEFNTASGFLALGMNTTGAANSANGYLALYGNTSGYGNTASGMQALLGNTTGSRNIALGYYAGYSITSGSNNICIGHEGTAADNATIRIGTLGTQTKTFVAGIYGVTASGGSAVYVNSSGQLGTSTSSRRFKTDIQDMGDSSDALLELRPVTFRYRPEIDPQGLPQYGLIAEEVEQVNPDLVVHDEQGRPYTVRYEAVNAMLLQEFLKEHRKVQELEGRLEKLERLLEPKLQADTR